jgi:hypothetical protein
VLLLLVVALVDGEPKEVLEKVLEPVLDVPNPIGVAFVAVVAVVGVGFEGVVRGLPFCVLLAVPDFCAEGEDEKEALAVANGLSCVLFGDALPNVDPVEAPKVVEAEEPNAGVVLPNDVLDAEPNDGVEELAVLPNGEEEEVLLPNDWPNGALASDLDA